MTNPDSGTRWVHRDGVTVELSVAGDGPIIVVIPSLGRGVADFDLITPGLVASGYRVLRAQPRGVAGSTGPLTGLTYHDFTADLALAITSETDEPVVLLGHAAGSRYARACATDWPTLVRGVVVAAGSASSRPPAPTLSTALNVCADPRAGEVARLDALRTAFFAPGHEPSAWLNGWHPAAHAAQRGASETLHWRTAGTAPVLDLQGALDPWRPADTRRELLDELGPRARCVMIPDAAHALLPEQPAAVVEAVTDWIRRL